MICRSNLQLNAWPAAAHANSCSVEQQIACLLRPEVTTAAANSPGPLTLLGYQGPGQASKSATRSCRGLRNRLCKSPTENFLDVTLLTPSSPAASVSTVAKGKVDLVTSQPPKVCLNRTQVLYHAKFGAFGVSEGSFSEPGGLCVNLNGEIVVADTNNHRIQVLKQLQSLPLIHLPS